MVTHTQPMKVPSPLEVGPDVVGEGTSRTATRHLPDGLATAPEQCSKNLEVGTTVRSKMHGMTVMHVRYRGRAYLEHASA